MGPAPSFSAYQTAANQVYEPQKAAEAAMLGASAKADVNTLEGGKVQVQTDYQSAIDALTAQTAKNVGTINQLYTERLGGNFSGLQGNDLGMMFSSANKQQATIESTRANKLSSIGIEEANTQNKYDTQISSLGSKYQGLEADYANKGYDTAVKDYQSNQYKQKQLDISQARLGIERQKAATGSTSIAATKQTDMSTIGGFLNGVVGKDGHVSQQNWNKAMRQWVDAGYSAAEFVKNNIQFVNQRYGGYHGFD